MFYVWYVCLCVLAAFISAIMNDDDGRRRSVSIIGGRSREAGGQKSPSGIHEQSPAVWYRGAEASLSTLK